jgi:hypothetical protein
MQLELILLPLAAAGLVLWLARLNHHPRWLLLLGAVGLMGLVSLLPLWLDPVDSQYGYGSCGSVLRPERPAADQNGVCESLRAEQYDATVYYLLGVIVVLMTAGVVTAARWAQASAMAAAVAGTGQSAVVVPVADPQPATGVVADEVVAADTGDRARRKERLDPVHKAPTQPRISPYST